MARHFFICGIKLKRNQLGAFDIWIQKPPLKNLALESIRLVFSLPKVWQRI